MCHLEDFKVDWEKRPDETAARKWCADHGLEFIAWDGTFCNYRDPRRAGTLLEYGMESHIG